MDPVVPKTWHVTSERQSVRATPVFGLCCVGEHVGTHEAAAGQMIHFIPGAAAGYGRSLGSRGTR